MWATEGIAGMTAASALRAPDLSCPRARHAKRNVKLLLQGWSSDVLGNGVIVEAGNWQPGFSYLKIKREAP